MSLVYIAAAGSAGFALNLVFHGVGKVLWGGSIEKELYDNNGIWRPMQDLRMLYAPLVSPFVSAAALAWALRLLGVSVVGSPHAGMKASLVLWLIGAGHGIWIDYCSTKMTARLATHFWLSTALEAALQGYLLSRFS